MPMAAIFDFDHYRDYLTHCLKNHPACKKPMSIAQWSKRLKLKSPRTIGMVLTGERRLAPTLARMLAKDLKLDQVGNEFFELLRQREATVEGPDTQLEQRIHELKRAHQPRKPMGPQYESVLDNWFILAVQQLLPALGDSYEPADISKRFGNKFTEADAKRALDFLVRQGIAVPQSNGSAKIEDQRPMSSSADIKSAKIQTYHESMMNMAFESIRGISADQRNLEALTIAYDPTQLGEMKKFIREFIFRFEAKFETVGSPHIAQLNLQFFPLTEVKS